MTLLWQGEWTRFIRNRTNLIVLAICAAILLSSGIWSGLSAKAYRLEAVATATKWQQEFAAHTDRESVDGDPVQVSTQTYNFARNAAPPALYPPLGGLALSASRFSVLSTNIHVGIESRYIDARKSEPIANPLLAALGMLDFSTVCALLLPLFVIGLAYGLVQEDRERGTWRLVCAQARRPWHILLVALSIRFVIVLLTVIAATGCGFIIDPGASASVFFKWITFVAAWIAFWTALCGLGTFLPFSSGATALALIGIWIGTSFVLPAAVSSMVEKAEPMPSRLESIATLRTIQQETESDNDQLLRAWYVQNPSRGPTMQHQTWPVSFVPRYLEQSRLLRPLMDRFDQTRTLQSHAIQAWSWLSPSLSVIATADALAGIDVARHETYVRQVNDFEDRWRQALIPKIMEYRSLGPADYAELPRFQYQEARQEATWSVEALKLFCMAGLLVLLCFFMRSHIGKP